MAARSLSKARPVRGFTAIDHTAIGLKTGSLRDHRLLQFHRLLIKTRIDLAANFAQFETNRASLRYD
ncbi:MAG: hypothetical protein WDM89_13380 [Rhizomicrobium sp.]